MSQLNLEKVKWKNFLSYGEQWSEVQLNRSPITLIKGVIGDSSQSSNGSGKSTITDVISFVLYGKTIRKSKKGNIVNRRNRKGLLCELEFNIDNQNKYKIVRGIKPDIFEVYENEKLLNQDASARDYQNILETRILKIGFTAFTQSIIVSKTLYTPFMQLPAPKRREYVESILRLQVFGDMLKVHKAKESNYKKDHSVVNSDYMRLSILHDECSNNISKLEEIIKSSTDDRRLKLQSLIDEKSELLTAQASEYKELKAKIQEVDSSLDSKYNMNKNALSKFEMRKSDLEESINKLETSEKNCSMCGHELSKEHIIKHKIELEEKLAKANLGISKLNPILDDLKQQVESNNKVVSSNNTIQSEMNALLKMLKLHKDDKDKYEKEITSLTADTTVVDKEREKLYNIVLEKDIKEKELRELDKRLNYCILINGMLKDSGIKSTIVDKSIPLINKLINQNLTKFGFFVRFELDSEFNENIAVRGFEPANYYDFSEGEKLRIDMAILLAWRDISMLQNAMFCNVLFLDEMTDASMDDEGIEIFSQMLTSLKDNNVFIISHKPEKLENIARSTIIIEKKDGYSNIRT